MATDRLHVPPLRMELAKGAKKGLVKARGLFPLRFLNLKTCTDRLRGFKNVPPTVFHKGRATHCFQNARTL